MEIVKEMNDGVLQNAWKLLVKGGKLDFWALRVQPWGSYQKDKEINAGLLPGCLLIVNIHMRCATAAGKTTSTDAGYGANIHELVKKSPKPSVLRTSSAGRRGGDAKTRRSFYSQR